MQPVPIAIGWVIAGALLLLLHVGMWDKPWRLKEPYTYIVGVATLMCGWIAWGITATGPITPIDAVANLIAVSASGSVIAIAYYVRDRLDKRDARAQAQGELLGRARSIRTHLTQEMIDRGENDPGRSN